MGVDILHAAGKSILETFVNAKERSEIVAPSINRGLAARGFKKFWFSNTASPQTQNTMV